MNAHESASITAVTDAPGFIAADDYRLDLDSINLDACSDPLSGGYIDLIGTPRPVGLIVPGVPFDRGAFERRNLFPNAVFADGFESP
jgi:hypothetical protein